MLHGIAVRGLPSLLVLVACTGQVPDTDVGEGTDNPPDVYVGEGCGSDIDGSCEDGSACHVLDGGGICALPCDPSTAFCPEDALCLLDDAGAGFCSVGGRLNLGEVCGGHLDCGPDLACLLDGDDGVCALGCDAEVEWPSPTTRCARLASGADAGVMNPCELSCTSSCDGSFTVAVSCEDGDPVIGEFVEAFRVTSNGVVQEIHGAAVVTYASSGNAYEVTGQFLPPTCELHVSTTTPASTLGSLTASCSP